jgi:hypothetical protein
MTDSLIKLTNPKFALEWNEEVLQVHKASLQKVAMFQARAQELIAEKTSGMEPKLIAYCLWLILKEVKPGITEEDVLSAAPGDLNFQDITTKLGFLSPTKMEAALGSQTKTDTETSSSTSAIGQDGAPEKSPN